MMTRTSKAIASTFHPTHEITLTRLDGTREIVPVMLVDDYAYTLTEWVNNADAPAGWMRSDLGWRWRGRWAPDGYKQTAKVSRLGRGSDPKGPRPADARLNLRMLSEQKQRWEDAANNARLPLTDWAVRALDEAAKPHAPNRKTGR